ncbi:MAG: acetyl-CoA carboxylase biotin carboxyl carrier protein [Flavobacteriaceae bacterium]|nr:acetyl-CoA carboxylase biotin carboxyl carrier protein [Flavobacteriaceae bacterium]
MDNKEIQNLIKFVAKSGVAEVKLKSGDFAISIKNLPEQIVATNAPQMMQQPNLPVVNIAAPIPAQQGQAQEAPQAAQDTKADAEEAGLVKIKSPMIGTFYRKPSPDKPVFVNVGDTIKKGDTVCIIEAMKLFNEIEAEVSGKIVKVLVDDSSPVEYDQPLFLVEPA